MLFLSVGMGLLSADIRTTQNQLEFSVQGESLMFLNSVGLALGGNLNPSSNLHIYGSAEVSDELIVTQARVKSHLEFEFQDVSSDTTLSDNSYIMANSSSGNLEIYLPQASTKNRMRYFIKKTYASNNVMIWAHPGEQIDGQNYIFLEDEAYGWLEILSTGSSFWSILSISGNSSLPDASHELLTTDGSDGLSGQIDYDDGPNFGGATWHIKNGGPTSGLTRKGYVRFDLSNVPIYNSSNTQLDLKVATHSVGASSLVYLYGLVDESKDNWDETTVTYATAPGNGDAVVLS